MDHLNDTTLRHALTRVSVTQGGHLPFITLLQVVRPIRDHILTVGQMNVSKDNPAILAIDNRECHVTLDKIDANRVNGLVTLSFPPHCSHRMQPLDAIISGPFKRYYNAA